MSLRFFADHCISKYIIHELRDAGHEVLRLKNYISPDSSDPVVISKAQELDSILVSLNGDFVDIAYNRGSHLQNSCKSKRLVFLILRI